MKKKRNTHTHTHPECAHSTPTRPDRTCLGNPLTIPRPTPRISLSHTYTHTHTTHTHLEVPLRQFRAPERREHEGLRAVEAEALLDLGLELRQGARPRDGVLLLVVLVVLVVLW
jgi:hypothetical protein